MHRYTSMEPSLQKAPGARRSGGSRQDGGFCAVGVGCSARSVIYSYIRTVYAAVLPGNIQPSIFVTFSDATGSVRRPTAQDPEASYEGFRYPDVYLTLLVPAERLEAVPYRELAVRGTPVVQTAVRLHTALARGGQLSLLGPHVVLRCIERLYVPERQRSSRDAWRIPKTDGR